MSAWGQKQTFGSAIIISALPPKADMCGALDYVRFGPKADIRLPDQLVGSGEQRREDVETKCLGRLKVYD